MLEGICLHFVARIFVQPQFFLAVWRFLVILRLAGLFSSLGKFNANICPLLVIYLLDGLSLDRIVL